MTRTAAGGAASASGAGSGAILLAISHERRAWCAKHGHVRGRGDVIRCGAEAAAAAAPTQAAGAPPICRQAWWPWTAS